MSEPQIPLSGYKSKIHESEDFENPNEGKPVLNDQDEYIFRLVKMPHVKTMPQLKKNNKTGKEETIQVDKAICEFEEEGTKNIVLAFWRVDSLNFSDDDFESAILRFFRRIGTPVSPDREIQWGDYFLMGMRFRARVAIGKGPDKKPNGKYFLDVPTCRKILASDMHPDAAATLPNGNAPQTNASGVSLADALKIARGSKNAGDAFAMLIGKVTQEVVQEFVAADKRGEIAYPIQ